MTTIGKLVIALVCVSIYTLIVTVCLIRLMGHTSKIEKEILRRLKDEADREDKQNRDLIQ